MTTSIQPPFPLGLPCLPGGRIYGSAGDPIGNASAISTLRYGPHLHGLIPLWNGLQWIPVPFAETTIAVTSVANRVHDLYAYLIPPNTLGLEIGPEWTSSGVRGAGSPVALLNGLLCKSGDPYRLLLGSFYCETTTTTQDTALKRLISNAYNLEPRYLEVLDSTNTWTGGTANVWRQAGGNSNNGVDVFCGDATRWVELDAAISGFTAAGGHFVSPGVGLNSTTANVAQVFGGAFNNSFTSTIRASYRGRPGIGYQHLYWLDINDGGTITFMGDNGIALLQSGMHGRIMG